MSSIIGNPKRLENSLDQMNRRYKESGPEWSRSEMLEYLDLKDSTETDQKLWNKICDIKTSKAKEILL